MISCRYAAKLQRFLDDEVSDRERAEIVEHVEEGCPQCRGELERLTAPDPDRGPVPPLPWGSNGGGPVGAPGPRRDTELPSVPGYRVQRPLGRGGRGVVYLADH